MILLKFCDTSQIAAQNAAMYVNSLTISIALRCCDVLPLKGALNIAARPYGEV